MNKSIIILQDKRDVAGMILLLGKIENLTEWNEQRGVGEWATIFCYPPFDD